jgi:hypothetical protein
MIRLPHEHGSTTKSRSRHRVHAVGEVGEAQASGHLPRVEGMRGAGQGRSAKGLTRTRFRAVAMRSWSRLNIWA